MSTYNNGFPSSINNLSEDEKKLAIKDFAEGSVELEECLLTMNMYGLNTRACCKGYHEIDDILLFFLDYYNHNVDLLALAKCMNAPYIVCEKDADIFNYLSLELINNPNVLLAENEFGKEIRFYGENCYQLIKILTRDIKSGKKNYQDEIRKKVNELQPPEFYYNSYVYGLIRNGFTYDEVNILNGILVLNACIRSENITREYFDDLCLKTGIDDQTIIKIKDKLKQGGIDLDFLDEEVAKNK